MNVKDFSGIKLNYDFLFAVEHVLPDDDDEDLSIGWANLKDICDNLDRIIAMSPEENIPLPPSPSNICDILDER